MKKNFTIPGEIYLFICALLWGGAFAVQSSISDTLNLFTLNALRCLIACVALTPVVIIINRRNKKDIIINSVKYGTVIGIFYCIAVNLQQYGIANTSSGISGFITSLYIVMVFIIGYITGKSRSKKVFLCVLIAIAGFLLMSLEGFTSIGGLPEIILLLASFFLALQITAIDKYVSKSEPLALTLFSFLSAGIISLVFSLIFEPGNIANSRFCITELIYLGMISGAVANTCQILGQKSVEPTRSSLIMSLESIFAALAGFVFLGQKMSLLQIIGGIVIFISVILSIIFVNRKPKTEQKSS